MKSLRARNRYARIIRSSLPGIDMPESSVRLRSEWIRPNERHGGCNFPEKCDEITAPQLLRHCYHAHGVCSNNSSLREAGDSPRDCLQGKDMHHGKSVRFPHGQPEVGYPIIYGMAVLTVMTGHDE